MPGGQRINKICLRGWRQIDWEKDCEYTFCYGASYLDGVRRKRVKPDEVLLQHDSWGLGGIIITYYKLPPIIQRIARNAFERGKDEAKAELKRWLDLRSRL